MLRQIRILTKAQLCNFLNINVARFSKDRKKKNGMIAKGLVWIMLIAMLCFYVGTLSYGYIYIGLERVLPMYLCMISGILIFFFGMLKAGSVIFQQNSYEILCSLPVSQTAIVVSRFLGMYLGNVILALAVMIPGIAVYGYLLHPGMQFYFLGVIGTLFLPLLPMTAAVLFGALITGVSSRMKHKSLVATALSMVLVIGVMLFSAGISGMEGEITGEMLKDFSGVVTAMIEKLYPPAVWLGNAMVDGNVLSGMLYFGVSIFVFVIMVILVASNFRRICRGLFSTTAKHNYQMTELKRTTILRTLYTKELKRYLSSSIYMTNTIIGPLMMVLIAGVVFFAGTEQIERVLPIEGGITALMPFMLAASACLMTTTCTSISMEGREWWIIKSLPIQTKTVFDSKILLNLSLMAPFYVVAEILSILALKPEKMELFWLLFLPMLFMIFACVFGITVNLRFLNLDWENEVTVVKQSASAMIGGLGGCLVIILCALPVTFITQASRNIIRLIIALAIMGVTLWLYQRNAKTELAIIG